MKAFWDDRYREAEAAYGMEPNVHFANALKSLPIGSILLPCDGEGRNALYAARAGWEVHSFDFSEAGVEKAKRWAASAGVNIHAVVADAFAYAPQRTFDAVALIFAHMPPPLRQDFHRLAASWLRPGGTLILEGFRPDQLQYSSGGPKDENMLFTSPMLCSDFQSLNILQCENTLTVLDEGPFHQGPAAVIRLIAQSPTC